MNSRGLLGTELKQYQSDFEAVTGREFRHFFCPILHVDEKVRLMKGHIVPASVGGKSTVLQRADVDNGFGSFFESEFTVAIADGLQRDDALERILSASDNAPRLQRFNLSVSIEGQNDVRVRKGRIGREKVFFVKRSDLRVGMGSAPARFSAELDAGSSALTTCLRACHLYWFKQLGYSYVFSREGELVAWVLRKFYDKFIRPRQRPRRKKPGLMSEKVKQEVNEYCLQFANFLRPVPHQTANDWPEELKRGTVDTGYFLVLLDGEQVYGKITIFRFGNVYSAVMTPIITDARGFALLTLAATLKLEYTLARWDCGLGHYEMAPPSGQYLIWPSAKESTAPISIREAAKLVLDSGRMSGADRFG